MNTQIMSRLCFFSMCLALTLVAPSCDKDVVETGLPAERFEDGRFHLDLVPTIRVDATEYLEKHPDAVSIRVANGSESSVRLSYRNGEDDVMSTQFAIQNDGQGVTITLKTAGGESFDYKL